jgi:hypothetical protein
MPFMCSSLAFSSLRVSWHSGPCPDVLLIICVVRCSSVFVAGTAVASSVIKVSETETILVHAVVGVGFRALTDSSRLASFHSAWSRTEGSR